MIILNPEQWHVRLFYACAKLSDKFFVRSTRVAEQDQSNFCQYVRVIIITAPIIILLHIAFVSLIIYTFVIYPIESFGLGIWTVAMSIIFGLIFGIKQWVRNQPSFIEPIKKQKKVGFLKLIFSFIVALKHNACPVIIIEKSYESDETTHD